MALSDSELVSVNPDANRRSRAVHRDRKTREKYWSFRVVDPNARQSVPHLDLCPPTLVHGKWRPTNLPLLPSEAPVVQLSKREVFNEAQKWPRPPRRHHADNWKVYNASERRRATETKLIGMSDAYSFGPSGVPKKNGRTVSQHVATPDTLMHYGQPFKRRHIDTEDLDNVEVEQRYFGAGWASAEWNWPVDPAAVWSDDGCHEDYRTASSWRDADALFERAEQKRACKLTARWKTLQRQGWDTWDDRSEAMSEPEWTHTEVWDTDTDAEGFEML